MSVFLPNTPVFHLLVVCSNPRAPEGSIDWGRSALAACKAHGFSPQLKFYFFPSGIPTVSVPLPRLNFFPQFTLSLPLGFLLPLLLLLPSLLFSHLLSCFSLPRCHLPSTTKLHTPPFTLSFCLCLVSFSHLVQCGLAHREVFDLQSFFIRLQLVENVSHTSWSNWYVVLHHSGVLVLCVREECVLNHLKWALWIIQISENILSTEKLYS